MQRIIKVILAIIWLLVANIAFAKSVIPADKIAETDCIKNSQSCLPDNSYDYLYESNCKEGGLDKISCKLHKLYGKNFVMAIPGDIETEGAYVRCNDNKNNENCTLKGFYSTTANINEATPSDKIAKNKFNKATILNPADNKPYYCPMTLCDVATVDIKFKIKGPYSTSGRLSNDETAQVNGITYKVTEVGNNLCAMLNLPAGWVYLGCKSLNPKPSLAANNSCFAKTACTNAGSHHSKVFWSVSGRVVECVSDILYLLFMQEKCNDTKNFLPALQDHLRTAVMAAVVLYVILFGIRVATGDQPPGKFELFMFVFKIGLVLYFSVGLKGDSGQYESGLNWVYSFGRSAMTSLSEYIIGAASSGGLCRYNPSEYGEYSYMALWDSLDCRVAYYLGLYDPGIAASAGTSIVSSTVFGILGLIIPAIFAMQILFVIFIIIYGLFIFSLLVYYVHFYVIAIIALAITIYLGVIAVPMALFQYTKKFFDNWLKVILSYVLQPVIITAFLAMMMLIFDTIIFGDCQFQTKEVGGYTIWYMSGESCTDPYDPRCKKNDKPKNSCLAKNSCATSTDNWASIVTSCKESLGWLLLGKLDQSLLESKTFIFADFTIFSSDGISLIEKLTTVFLKVVIFAYLMSLFSESLNAFAADITSGPNIGRFATDPGNLFSQIMNQLRSKGGGGKGKGSGKGGGGGGKGIKVSSAKRSGIKVSK